jgi:hypothetical protein
MNKMRRLFMGILSGNQQNEPMHYGEIFSAWTHLAGMKSTIATYQIYENHCGDEDLLTLINSLIGLARQEEKQLETLLKENGIALPPSPPERPKASMEDIPAGAKYNDPEIAMAISTDLAAGLIADSKAMGQSTREDIAMMYGQFHTAKAQEAGKLLRLNKEKGWLVVPPLHEKPRELQMN